MKRRNFLKQTALAGMSGLILPRFGYSFPAGIQQGEQGELLYNGIRLPDVWPPRNMDSAAYLPMPVPYLNQPPAVIPIDVGRQLFIDNFLKKRRKFVSAFGRNVDLIYRDASQG